MPEIPYPLTGETLDDLRVQTVNLFGDIYENGIGGAEVGDTFSVEGDVLTLRLHDSGGLKKVSNQLSIKLPDDSGLQLTSTGLAANNVSQGHLNTSEGSVGGSTGNYILPGGSFGFYPQTKGTSYYAYIAYSTVNESYLTLVYMNGTTPYAQQTYITASGEVFWIFLLSDKQTGKIIAGYQAPDHPCFGNTGDPLLSSHPFMDYDEKNHEIIVVNPSEDEIKQMKMLCRSPRMGIPPKDMLELFINDNPIIEINNKEEREYPKIPVTVATIKDEDMRPVWMQKEIKVIKIPIPQPDYIKVYPIKRIRDAIAPISA